MPRFFVQDKDLSADNLILTGENADHAKVLRLKNGEQVTVCDGLGNECICFVSKISGNEITLSVNSRQASKTEPKVKASMYMAFSKGDKIEHIIQKATELGAYELVVFPSARCVSKPDNKSLTKKLERWQKIAMSAAEQSGRGCIPQVLVLDSYKNAVKRASQSDISILFYENEQTLTLHNALENKGYESISLLTGPEGGLEKSEVAFAVESGLAVCTLGKRILRCETAPLCALSAVMYDSGEF